MVGSKYRDLKNCDVTSVNAPMVHNNRHNVKHHEC